LGEHEHELLEMNTTEQTYSTKSMQIGGRNKIDLAACLNPCICVLPAAVTSASGYHFWIPLAPLDSGSAETAVAPMEGGSRRGPSAPDAGRTKGEGSLRTSAKCRKGARGELTRTRHHISP
jgi:hypothetical protein